MTPALEAEESALSLRAYGPARSTIQGSPLSERELRKIHAYRRAASLNLLITFTVWRQDHNGNCISST